MKKRLIAFIAVLVMTLTFGLVACGTKTDKVEEDLVKIESVISDLKTQLAANKLDLTALATALAGINTNSASLEQLAQLTEIVNAIKAQTTAQSASTADAEIYEAYVAALRDAVTSSINKTGKAYGGVHTVYVGVAEVVTNSGVVTSVTLDEYFLPSHYATGNAAYWAVSGKEVPEADRVADGANFTAKYIQVGSVVFQLQVNTDGTVKKTAPAQVTGGTGSAVAQYSQVAATGAGISGNVTGFTASVTDLTSTITRNEKAAEWYVTAVGDLGAGFKVLRTANSAEVTANTGIITIGSGANEVKLIASGKTAADYGSGVHKTQGKYWPTDPDDVPAGTTLYPLGWKGNIAAIEATAKATQLSVHYSRFTKPTNTYWQAAGGSIYTGATANDFPHYLALAQRAYVKALLQG